MTYIEEKMPLETPILFQMHMNAEIGFLTMTSAQVFEIIGSMTGGGGGGGKKDSNINVMIDAYKDSPELITYNMIELKERVTELTPYTVVCLQECERMNILVSEIKRSLLELQRGLKGELNITDAMDSLAANLNFNSRPPGWEKLAQFSLKPLTAWFADLLLRIKQQSAWSKEFKKPYSIWCPGLFNPMSFLTAIIQTTSRAKGIALDAMANNTEITEMMDLDEITGEPEEGAFIHGLFFEGAGWDRGEKRGEGRLMDATPKILHPPCPIINVISVPLDQKFTVGYQVCPIYITSARGATFICTGTVKMDGEDSDDKYWILQGTCLILNED